ncbi:MAG: helix-turn-helix domain-containing protein, partial [Pseudorhodoplanes sp.]
MRSVLVAFEILEAIAERQPVGVGEIARALELPKSTVQRALLTLAQGGWIRSTHGEVTRWRLTTKPLVVGMRAAGLDGVRDAALPVMHRIRAEVNETTNLTLFEGNFAV